MVLETVLTFSEAQCLSMSQQHKVDGDQRKVGQGGQVLNAKGQHMSSKEAHMRALRTEDSKDRVPLKVEITLLHYSSVQYQ